MCDDETSDAPGGIRCGQIGKAGITICVEAFSYQTDRVTLRQIAGQFKTTVRDAGWKALLVDVP